MTHDGEKVAEANAGAAATSTLEDIFEPEHGAATLAPAVVRATDLTGVHVLKHDNLFMLSNAHGDVRPDGRGLGLYDGDTRLLSTYDLLLNGLRPVVLRAGPAASYQQLDPADQPGHGQLVDARAGRFGGRAAPPVPGRRARSGQSPAVSPSGSRSPTTRWLPSAPG